MVSLLSVPIGLQPCILSLALSTLKEEMIESNCKEIEHPASPSQEINIFDKTYSMQTLSQEHKIRAYFLQIEYHANISIKEYQPLNQYTPRCPLTH